MKVGFLITARLKSTRLPKKLMLEIADKPMISHMIDRLKVSKRIDQIILCTSTNAEDDPLEKIAASEDIHCFRGDEDDVLKRLYDAASKFEIDYILNVTGDCPFVDPIYADKIVESYQSSNADLVRAMDLPHGAYCYGMKPSALKKILDIKTKKDSEVWGKYFTDTDLFNVLDLDIENPLHRQPSLRMTLDYSEDFKFFKEIFGHLYRPGNVFSLDDILLLLKEHPEIIEINRHCEKMYQKRVNKQASIELKSRYPVKKALVFGCGSIGQRHIRNLVRLGIKDIAALRSNKGSIKKLDPQLKLKEITAWDDALKFEPDIALICNPTALHIESAKKIVPHVRGIFIEKPLSASLDGIKELLLDIKRHKTTSFVGFNLQFHPAINTVQSLLEDGNLGKPILFQCQVGQWLPDWHPYEDYLKGYYAVKELGGGATLTLCHELRLAIELMGPAKTISCVFTPSELLPLEVDVISDVMIQHERNATSQVHLDFIQRPLQRSGTIFCERGKIFYDLVKQNVLFSSEKNSHLNTAWENPKYDVNDSYIKELELFITYTSEGRTRHQWDAFQASETQTLIDAAFRSEKLKRSCEIPILEMENQNDKRKISTI